MPEFVKAICLIGKAIGQLLDTPVRSGGKPCARDTQSQREAAAMLGNRGVAPTNPQFFKGTAVEEAAAAVVGAT